MPVIGLSDTVRNLLVYGDENGPGAPAPCGVYARCSRVRLVLYVRAVRYVESAFPRGAR